MKKDIHPDNYRNVVFLDTTINKKILVRSTAPSNQTTTWEDGKTYPLVKIETSSFSHPFHTGEKVLVDSTGMVEKFKKKYAKKK